MSDAFIKLYKKMIDWEWYDDANAVRLFIHCLLKANWRPTHWHGIEIGAGQFITSLPSLAAELNLSIKQVRTALNKLKSTGEVADKPTNKYRIITVNNWAEYQGQGRQRADKGQASGRQRAPDKEIKELKNIKNINNTKNGFGCFNQRQYDFDKLMQKEGDG